MRQIKFRAKSIRTNEWVYGNLRIFGERAYISAVDSHAHSEVFLSTVGQYTGLTDRNGKEIYEGDIVEACSQGEHRKCEVAWSEKTVSFFLKHSVGPWSLSGAWGKESCEVIGNIYDNPELLKKSDHE